MQKINLERLASYRGETYRTKPALRVTNPEEALRFVEERSFIFFWPISGQDLPSLWQAVAGNRRVSDNHDDPGHITWGWKDAALPKRIWYYAKILRRKATFISLKITPYFYALSENYGSPEEDYLLAYREGRLTQAARQVYEALLDKGSLDTITLRKEARLVNAKESEFNRALEDLQADFKIMPVGIAEVGAWKYAYRYELTARHMPELAEQARPVGEALARRELVELYFASVGAACEKDMRRLFGWSPELVRRTLDKLISNEKLRVAEHPKQPENWLALPGLVK